MIVIKKKGEPQELLNAKRNGCHKYEDLRGDVRTAIRKQLYEEQGACLLPYQSIWLSICTSTFIDLSMLPSKIRAVD